MYPPTPLSHASVSKILGSKQVAIAYARPHGHQYHQETCVFASVLRTYAQEVSALTPDGRREMLTGRTLTETRECGNPLNLDSNTIMYYLPLSKFESIHWVSIDATV